MSVMTGDDLRKALRAMHASGVVWEEIAHRANLLAGRRVLNLWTLRRFVVEGREIRQATAYWLERLVAAHAEAAESEVTR